MGGLADSRALGSLSTRRRITGAILAGRVVCTLSVFSLSGVPSSSAAAVEPAPAADIMPFKEVREGMKGSGRTVFRASRVEEFDVEILGKLENIGPGQNLILARLSGGPLAETGVLEGMSGSPVSIGGRMIGAVSYSWGFARSAVAGITPIAEMLRMEAEVRRASGGAPPGGAGGAVRLPKELRSPIAALERSDLVRYYRQRLAGLSSPVPTSPSALRPLGIPIALEGFSAKAALLLAPGPSILPDIQGSAASAAADLEIEPGSAIGIALVKGDVQATAVGTVTRVDGDRVLAFGHPLFNLGPVELPMVRARVETLMPSLQSSFKFAGPAGEAGSIQADRTSGVVGQLGPRARMIPVRVEIDSAGAGGGQRTFNFEVADHPLLSPQLIFLALGGIFDTLQSGGGETSVELSEGSVIRLSGNRRVSLAELFAGEDATLSAAATVAFLSQILMENEYEPTRIEGISLSARTSQDRRTGRITAAWCSRNQVRAGESLIVSVSVKPFRQAEKLIPIKIDIPAELPPGHLTLHVGDALALYRTENEARGGPQPRDLDHLVSLINGLRRSEKIYVLGTKSEPSLWMGDTALPNLPPSKASVILDPDSAGNLQILRMRPVLEASASTGTSLEGYRRLDVEVVP